jgi:parallel beta-helix repeat protein
VEAALADRETIVASGSSSSDVNDAITDMNNAGGGIVRLDGLIDMDANITMKSNVVLMGYGKGTGLRNNTANAYTIDFQGTALTYYNCVATTDNDFITTSTAADAGNFSQGDWFICKADDSGPVGLYMLKCKTNGVTGTGVVDCYGRCPYSLAGTDKAAPMSGAVRNSGMLLMDVVNTSSGSIEIDIDVSHDLTFIQCYFEECTITAAESGRISIEGCTFDCLDNQSLTAHIQLEDYIDGFDVRGCLIQAADNGIYWAGSKGITNIALQNNEFKGCGNSINFSPSYGAARCEFVLIEGNRFVAPEFPDGAGTATAILVAKTPRFWTITDNFCDLQSSGKFITATYHNTTYFPLRWTIANNMDNSASGISIQGGREILMTNNTWPQGAVSLTSGPLNCTIVGNTGSLNFVLGDNGDNPVKNNTIAGNRILGLTIQSSATKAAEGNTISGNKLTSFSITDVGVDNVITGNMIDGNVTFGTAASDTQHNTVFTGNNVDGTVTFNEAGSDYVVVTSNTTDGAITALTGTDDVQDHNTVY